MQNQEKTMEKIVALCKGRGFVYPGSELNLKTTLRERGGKSLFRRALIMLDLTRLYL